MALLWVAIVAVAVLGVVRPWSDTAVVQPTQPVIVQPGDTLWELAGELTPTADPRATVARIIEINGLSTASDIHPGDQLLVPAG